MDPVTAAGLGISVTSLALQVFAGCITTYQLFVDAEEMPETYGFLRVRLRFEQSRLLRWGEKVGLAETLLDNPSRVLQLNRNLIFDILLEIQALFKRTVKIQIKYDKIVPEKSLHVLVTESSQNPNFLKKTLNAFNKLPQAPSRLKWSMIKHDEFRGLVEKLIGLNDAIEGLLEVGVVEQLLEIQRQTFMTVLQVSDKVDELRHISSAMQLQRTIPTISTTNVNTVEFDVARETSNQELAGLASFKAEEASLDKKAVQLQPLDKSDLVYEDDEESTRCEAIYQSRSVWVEWKDYDSDNQNPEWETIISNRVKGLVVLLSSLKKSPQFKVPHCLGYFTVVGETASITKYGLVYELPLHEHPSQPAETFTTLYDILSSHPRPSLNKRIELALTLSRSLMYLHSVNWLHKTIRSSNILFFFPSKSDSTTTTKAHSYTYTSPIISGFEYSRADLLNEQTELVPSDIQNSFYRHPSTQSSLHIRSKKSHDIYSLGIVLVEIAYWAQIQAIVGLSESDQERKVRRAIRNLRGDLLGEERMEEVRGMMGEGYADVVKVCLEGVGVGEGENEEDPVVGVRIQKEFWEGVVKRLGEIRL